MSDEEILRRWLGEVHPQLKPGLLRVIAVVRGKNPGIQTYDDFEGWLHDWSDDDGDSVGER